MICEMKDILKTMVDNNEPHWSADTMDMVRVELHHVYTKAAKSDEYEAKAKAFDNLVDVAYWHFERIHPDDDNRLQYESFYDDIRDEFKKLESGESNA